MKKMKYPVKNIIIHTAAAEREVDMDEVKEWHLEKGYDDIGYHFFITGSWYSKYDTEFYKPEIQIGRKLIYQGSHARFHNNSIGICLSGHGDKVPFTDEQKVRLYSLIQTLARFYGIRNEKVIGHRETAYEKLNLFKTCPGSLINMDVIRFELMNFKTIDYVDEDWFLPQLWLSTLVSKDSNE